MILLSLAWSRMFAHQPITRLLANVGVKISRGRPTAATGAEIRVPTARGGWRAAGRVGHAGCPRDTRRAALRQDPDMYLVTGATGNVGGHLVDILAGAGHQVTALVRDPAGYPRKDGVRAVAGDLDQPDTLRHALSGAEAMFLLGGFADLPGVLQAALTAGVRQVVLLSSRSVVGGKPDNAVVAMHSGSEEAVRDSGLDWTLLRPSGFMSNDLTWAERVRAGQPVAAPFGTVPIAVIDPWDIAAVAAAVLTSDGAHHGRDYPLSGPAALTPAERVGILGQVLGRDLPFHPVPDDVARVEMSQHTPEPYVDAFFRFFADGEFDDTPVVQTVHELTGRPARDYWQWAESHADRFR
jgi:uncharacterized protein YbjT (DUF2867 family)